MPLIETRYGERPNRYVIFGALPSSIPLDHESKSDELLCNMVLHHLPDYKSSIESMMQLIKPKGRYFITTFNSTEREQIENIFSKIVFRKGVHTRGDYKLESVLLRDQDIYFHDNNSLMEELNKYSSKVKTRTLGKIFQIFEGIKRAS